MTEQRKATNKYLFIILGLLIVLIGNIPFFILRERIVFPVNDQLDGEIVVYMLKGNHLFSGDSFYPEYMGGVQSTALTAPSNLTILFFAFLSPLYAFIVNNMFVMIFAFIGMYLWSRKLGANTLISAVVGLLFAFLPFYPVYGLSMAGVPLVAWGLSTLADKEERARFRIFAYLAIALYGFSSSLVLCGYAVLAVGCAVLIVLLIVRKNNARVSIGGFLSGVLLLLTVYVIENLSLLAQILGLSESYISQKSEYVLDSRPFLDSFIEKLFHGVLLTDSHHAILAEIVIIATVFAALMMSGKLKMKDNNRSVSLAGRLALFSVSGLLIAVFSAVYHTQTVRNILNKSGSAVKAFQLDRFTWLLPSIWFSCLALILCLLISLIKKKSFAAIAVLLFLVPCAFTVLKISTFKENAMELVRTNSTALNWKSFFCEEQFSEVASYIETGEGKNQSEYRVGCLGIEPSVAIYNGFYTIDGYSNNYDVEYKHRFRKIIAKELDKSPYNKQYFDDWGNRCYLFSSGYYGNEFLSKYTHPHFDNLEFDTSALNELGCSYILAAGEIADAEDRGYELLNVFDKAEWTYFVYLYKVK